MFHKEETFNEATMMDQDNESVQDSESIKKATVFGKTFVPYSSEPIFTQDEMDALMEAESAFFNDEFDLNSHSSFIYL